MMKMSRRKISPPAMAASPASVALMKPEKALAFLSPLPVAIRIHHHAKVCQPVRTTPSAHLRRRPPPIPPPNTGYGSRERPTKSLRHPDLTLFTRVWEPVQPPTAGVIIIPGLQWHSGWFSTIATPLSRRGVRVLAIDPLSTGRSDDILGMRSLILTLDDHVEDAAAALKELIKGLPKGSPVFVLAESSGGVIACKLAKKPGVSDLVHGWILCAPAIAVAPRLLPPRLILNILQKVGKHFPKLPMPGERISGETYDKAFGDGISHAISKSDPHVLYKVPIPLGTATAVLGAMKDIEKSLGERSLWMREVLVLHNSADTRTQYKASQGFVDRVKTRNGAKLLDMGGMAHQLFQERVGVVQETVDTIVRFVERVRDSP